MNILLADHNFESIYIIKLHKMKYFIIYFNYNKVKHRLRTQNNKQELQYNIT